MEPLDFGFMMRVNEHITFQDLASDGYVIFQSFRPRENNRGTMMEHLQEHAIYVEQQEQLASSFWPLGYRVEDDDPTVLVFQRFHSRESYEKHFATSSVVLKQLYSPFSKASVAVG